MNKVEYAKLERYLGRWISVQAHDWYYREPADIAAELAKDMDFAVIRLGGLLRSPDGAALARVVAALLPYPYHQAANVLTEAVTIAATRQTKRERLTAAGFGGAIALAIVVFRST